MRSDTDGLASAYQIMQVTDGGGPVLETGGNLLIGVITLPYSEIVPLIPAPPESSATKSEKEFPGPHNRLAIEMSENRLFRQLVERGLADLGQGRYKEIAKEKMTSGVV
jgi:hypothetical protein